jgi:hypothetical protein
MIILIKIFWKKQKNELPLQLIERKDQTIIVNDYNYELIKNVNNKELLDEKIILYSKEIFINYIGDSRIDGYPIFKVDTRIEDREEKINKLLNEKKSLEKT